MPSIDLSYHGDAAVADHWTARADESTGHALVLLGFAIDEWTIKPTDGLPVTMAVIAGQLAGRPRSQPDRPPYGLVVYRYSEEIANSARGFGVSDIGAAMLAATVLVLGLLAADSHGRARQVARTLAKQAAVGDLPPSPADESDAAVWRAAALAVGQALMAADQRVVARP